MPRVKQIVGLDLGARAARAAWVQMQAGAPRVTRLETLALPVEAQDTMPLVRGWLAKIGLADTFCALALPGTNAVFQTGRLPHNDPRTPQQAAAMDLVQFNEMAGDTMRHDLQAFEAPSEPGHTLYLIAMARPVAIDRALQAATQCGVRTADLIPSPVALYNALEPLAGPHTQPWIYADIGHQQTDVAIGLPQGLLFARTLPLGGRAFSDALAQALNLTPAQAETRKHTDARLDDDKPHAAPLRTVAERLAGQIHSCLGVYRSQFGASLAPTQLVLTGGGGRLPGLPAFLSTQLRLPVVKASELPGAGASGVSEWIAGGDLAVGLAMTALEAAPAHFSLLPSSLRHEVVFREKKPYWIAAAVFGALALGLFTANGLSSLRHDRQRLESERAELRKCETLRKQIDELRARGEQIGRRVEPVVRMLVGGPVARRTLTLVANSINASDWITLFCDEASYQPPAAEPPAPPKPPARSPFALFRDLRVGGPPAAQPPSVASAAPVATDGNTVFIIEGYTPDPSLGTVKQMLGRLRTCTTFVIKADLLADDRVLPPKDLSAEEVAALPPYRRFVIQIEVSPRHEGAQP